MTPLRNIIFDQNRVGVQGGFRLRVCSVHRKRHYLKLRKAMCPNDFPFSKVDHLSPRKKRTILVLFFSINFMLGAVLLPKIQPIPKPKNCVTATPSFRKELLRFMLGGNGHFSTTFCRHKTVIYPPAPTPLPQLQLPKHHCRSWRLHRRK